MSTVGTRVSSTAPATTLCTTVYCHTRGRRFGELDARGLYGPCGETRPCGVEQRMFNAGLTLSSSKTPLRILSRMSRVACSNAVSTFTPLFALASTNNSPSSFAHSSASSVVTSRDRLPGPCASSAQRSILFPTSIHVRCGSACSRTSANHERALTKADKKARSAGCEAWAAGQEKVLTLTLRHVVHE